MSDLLWVEIVEPVDDNTMGFCSIDFTQNFGVPISWSSISEPVDVTT